MAEKKLYVYDLRYDCPYDGYSHGLFRTLARAKKAGQTYADQYVDHKVVWFRDGDYKNLWYGNAEDLLIIKSEVK